MQKIILFFGQVDKQENKPHSHPRGIRLNAPNWNTNWNALLKSFIKATAMKMEYVICHYVETKTHDGNILKLSSLSNCKLQHAIGWCKIRAEISPLNGYITDTVIIIVVHTALGLTTGSWILYCRQKRLLPF